MAEIKVILETKGVEAKGLEVAQNRLQAHLVGAVLGAGGATVAEIQINKALKDGRVDENERALMHANYWMIRVGLAFIILSSIAIVLYQLNQGNKWVLTSQKLWIKELMVVAIIINAVALSYRWIPLWLGSSVSFTSWWGATLLGVAGRLPYSFDMQAPRLFQE